MADRFGWAVYWACCIAAAIAPLPSFAWGVGDLMSGGGGAEALSPWFHLLSGIGVGILFYLAGRGFRSALAEE